MFDGAQTSTPAAGAPVVGWASGPLGAVQAADREIARATAARARAVAEFAASRPAAADRAQGERGAMSAQRWAARAEVLRPVSEWATAELAVALNLTQQGAEGLLGESLTLVHRLPATLDGLEAGLLHRGHLWHLLDKVAPIADAGLRAEVEAELLAWMGWRRRVTSPAQLGDKARVLVARRDASAAARRLARALEERGVSLRPERAEGMAAVTIVCTMPEAKALSAALVQYAEALEDDPDGPPRTRGDTMVDALLDLVLRPGEAELPPVRVLLHVVASMSTLLGGDAPGEVDGELVPAEMARQLVRALAGRGLLPAETAQAAAGGADPAEPATRAAPATPAESGEQAAPATRAGSATRGESGEQATPATRSESADRAASAERASTTGSLDWFDDPTWWAEAERRIAANGFSGAGLPGWSQLLGAGREPGEPYWSETVHPPNWVTDPGQQAEWIAAGQEREQSLDGEQSPDSWPPPEHAAGPPPVQPPSPVESPPTSGWWAAADRAVQDAGAAVHAAGLALGHAQRSVRTAQCADAAAEAAWRASPTGRVDAAPDALGALAAAADAQRAELADLLGATGGGGLADRPRLVLADAVTGALRTLTDLPGLRRVAHCGAPACRRAPEDCSHDLTGRPGLRAPDPTDGYAPGAALDRFVRARDRRCRFPGCRRRVPKAGELDHHLPHAAGGETAAANLAGYCTGDHRGKHQASGWTHDLTPDGTLTVTTPTGLTAVTTPPPY